MFLNYPARLENSNSDVIIILNIIFGFSFPKGLIPIAAD